MRRYALHSLFLFLSAVPAAAWAADPDAGQMSLWWGLPFALILLSIAVFPLVFSSLWHHHFGKITAFWTALFLVPYTWAYGWGAGVHVVAHALIGEYIPFILLLLALYTISGGILVWGSLNGNPRTNTVLLAIGTVLASVMGTTGAAMLLIRPLLRANEHRKNRVHSVVFFIFLVANVGGGLTPLGDPPLFLGFLKGVSFMWTVQYMLVPVLISTVILLFFFHMLDSFLYKQEGYPEPPPLENAVPGIKLFGKANFWLLGGVVSAVLMSGLWQPEVQFYVLGNVLYLQNLVRDLILVALALVSLWITPKQVRAGNEFNWAPMLEVGKLFLGIFITISPVLAILKVGEAGHFKGLIQMVHDAEGQPVNAMYFWMTGLLSAFLDNAPTYLVFFNMAGGDAEVLMTGMSRTLLAVSMGSVFMGALSYIGNAPNFMVKSIAEQRHVKMPSFFGYMGWSFGVLMPLFMLHTLLFFVF